MKALVFADPVARDLEGIIDTIALDNPVAAEKVFREISASAERLRHFPDLRHPGRTPDTRELSLSSQPYILAYAVSADIVTILAVFHVSRNLMQALAERQKEMGR